MARKLFYVSASILMLALSYNLGARRAEAQSGSHTIVGAAGVGTRLVVVTDTGDVYANSGGVEPSGLSPSYYVGNFWAGATAVTPTTLGRVKASYR